MAHRAEKVRRASGAARIVARDLMQRLGHFCAPLPNKQSGAAKWPDSFVGSMAHDADIAVAAVGLSTDFCAIGIDVEPREGLEIELHEIVARPSENRKISGDLIMGRMLFVVKEAVFKAVNEVDHLFLEFHDIEVDLDRGEAHVANGRVVKFRPCFGSHLVALAFIPRHFSN
jgi:4'-phosphopantetheinyl transferase EntD